ncbi:MAG: alpha/beta hydrolase [Ruminococcaceae bacterium]|nr:alpha/beta hydrolase [Oscillospiraceae bacterium]
MPEILRPQIVDFAAYGVTVKEAVPFGTGGSETLLMDCFYLEGSPAPRPAIIWIHGGGFTEEWVTRLSRPEKSFLALVERGYFIASIDYRLAQVDPFPAQIHDAKCAVRYLKAHAEALGIDPDRIAVWGESCGGQLAGLMAVRGGIEGFEGEGGWNEFDSDIAAAVSWYGGFNIAKFTAMQQDPRFITMYGGTFAEKRDLVIKASPITYADKPLCPFLAMCSNTDNRVPDSQSQEFCDAARAAGNDADFLMVPGQGHGYFEGDAYYDKIYAFFDKHLK